MKHPASPPPRVLIYEEIDGGQLVFVCLGEGVEVGSFSRVPKP